VIGLVFRMIAARPAQALAVFLLSAVVTAAAVAGPVALREVDQSIARAEVAGASSTERSLSVTAFVNPSATQGASQFDTIAKLVQLPDFETVRAGEFEAFGPVIDPKSPYGVQTSRMVFRDRICEHLVIVAGRCLAGPLEIVVGVDSAKAAGIHAGDVAVVQAAKYEQGRGLVPDGPETRLTVVGTYTARDPDEAYWAGQQYFPITANGSRHEAVFLSPQTFDLIGHTLGQSSLDSIAPADVLTVDRLAGLNHEITQLTAPLTEQQSVTINTHLPDLADRFAANRAVAHELVPVAFIPLVALCFFVIYLAVGYGIFGRRQELGLVALRGVTSARRWWLATGETGLVIVAGAPVGYLLGYASVSFVARTRFDGAAVPLSLSAFPYAALALAGSLVVALLGQRRAVAEPVVELLRGVPRTAAGWRSLVAEALVVALAVGATVQLRTTADGLRGVSLLVPGLVVVAVVLMAARAFGPAAALAARSALRRGWLGPGLAAVQLARRPGSHRLFVLVAVSTAMLAFVAAGMDVAATARADRARIVTGAPRVLTVDGADVRSLLHATRQVDPAGAWAMAVMTPEQTYPGAPKVLAVDTTRLASVATWRDGFGPSAAKVAAKLAPPKASPLLFNGRQIELDVETFPGVLTETDKVDMTVTLAPLAGGDVITVAVPDLALGREVRRLTVVGCTQGCKLTALSLSTTRRDSVRLLVHAVRQFDPPADVVSPAVLIDRRRWRGPEGVVASPLGDALQISATATAFSTGVSTVASVDAPVPVPVATTGSLAASSALESLDGSQLPATAVAPVAMLPRLGADGVLVDLEYLERTDLFSPRRDQGEVWLGPKAPADAVDRLRAAGLAVSRETGVEANLSALSRQGPALALQFHLAAALFGIALALGGLALVATVDRRRRAVDLSALRTQGLSQRTVDQAALWGYLSTVLIAAVAGLLAAVVAWLLAGDRLPVFTDTLDAVQPPRWPATGAVLLPWITAAAAMVVGSVVAAWALRRATRNGRG
jgi:putative ABC transport system permease protein